MHLSLDDIRENPANARHISASNEADVALMESMRLLGLLQPVLVAPEEGESGVWSLRAGHRRYAAARALGWPGIRAVTIDPVGMDGEPVPEEAISAAENMVRAAMHPVDQWRAVNTLRVGSGYNLETAAAALGIPLALARKMEHLGKMDPSLLDALGTGDLPSTSALRVIAMAPLDVQRNALKSARHKNRDGATLIDWDTVAEGCTVRRIPQSRARFDIGLMAWDEDLFAEPTALDRFSTTDIETFLSNQRLVMTAMVAKGKGRIEVAGFDQYGSIAMPKDWVQDYAAEPKRWTKADKRRVFVALHESGYRIGDIARSTARPKIKANIDVHERETPVRPQISKKTMQHLAVMKEVATAAELEEVRKGGAAAMLELLLLVATFKNVKIANTGFREALARRLVGGDGRIRDLLDDELCELAVELIKETIRFDAPDVFDSSGPAAEWLAQSIEVKMPRTDTAEVLKGIAGYELMRIAAEAGIKTAGTIGALRKRMEGALPDWRAVNFTTPGPQPMDAEFEDASEDGEAEDDA